MFFFLFLFYTSFPPLPPNHKQNGKGAIKSKARLEEAEGEAAW